jgi:hypothetical protein
MIEYIGNSSEVIDWNDVISNIERCGFTSHPGPFTGPSHKAGDPIPLLNEVTDIWTNEGYKCVKDGGSVEWDMFFPGVHFDQSIVDKFVKYFGIENYDSAWISRVWPGNFAPMHWDVNNNEAELLKLPNRQRWHANISKPAFGHIFIVDDVCLYNKEQGSTYKWDDRRYWHAGSNIGLVPKYQFNLW